MGIALGVPSPGGEPWPGPELGLAESPSNPLRRPAELVPSEADSLILALNWPVTKSSWSPIPRPDRLNLGPSALIRAGELVTNPPKSPATPPSLAKAENRRTFSGLWGGVSSRLAAEPAGREAHQFSARISSWGMSLSDVLRGEISFARSFALSS